MELTEFFNESILATMAKTAFNYREGGKIYFGYTQNPRSEA
jgi:hypothetical protein